MCPKFTINTKVKSIDMFLACAISTNFEHVLTLGFLSSYFWVLENMFSTQASSDSK